MENEIIRATEREVEPLTDFFWRNMLERPAYISHGEFQMGVARPVAGNAGEPSPGGKAIWRDYIRGKIGGSRSCVLWFPEDGRPAGFIVLSVEEDGHEPFGVICDLLVDPEMRGRGVGGRLLEAGKEWLLGQGVHAFYLESGKNNHSAHAFFEKKGFALVSHIFASFER